MVAYRRRRVQGRDVFYREAGDPAAPTLVLLHGYPSSSFMFRQLIPALEDQLHLIAPDYPGFGNSDAHRPPSSSIPSTPSPRSWRDCSTTWASSGSGSTSRTTAPPRHPHRDRRPDAIQAVIVQNGNAYEGLSPAWAPLRDGLWRQRTAETGQLVIEASINPERIKANWTAGARDPEGLSPDGWNMDRYFMTQPHRRQIQLELLYDYRHNLARYPEFQVFLRHHRPPVLIVWDEQDPYFTVADSAGVSARPARCRAAPAADRPLRPRGAGAHCRPGPGLYAASAQPAAIAAGQ